MLVLTLRLVWNVAADEVQSAGQVELSFGLKNILGYAESTTFSGQYGSASSNEFSVSVSKPRIYGYPLNSEVQLLQQFSNFQKWSSFTERLRGGVFSLSRSGPVPMYI